MEPQKTIYSIAEEKEYSSHKLTYLYVNKDRYAYNYYLALEVKTPDKLFILEFVNHRDDFARAENESSELIERLISIENEPISRVIKIPSFKAIHELTATANYSDRLFLNSLAIKFLAPKISDEYRDILASSTWFDKENISYLEILSRTVFTDKKITFLASIIDLFVFGDFEETMRERTREDLDLLLEAFGDESLKEIIANPSLFTKIEKLMSWNRGADFRQWLYALTKKEIFALLTIDIKELFTVKQLKRIIAFLLENPYENEFVSLESSNFINANKVISYALEKDIKAANSFTAPLFKVPSHKKLKNSPEVALLRILASEENETTVADAYNILLKHKSAELFSSYVLDYTSKDRPSIDIFLILAGIAK